MTAYKVTWRRSNPDTFNAEHGYGDFPRWDYVDLGTVSAPTLRKAQAAARRLGKAHGVRLTFSGVGASGMIAEVGK